MEKKVTDPAEIARKAMERESHDCGMWVRNWAASMPSAIVEKKVLDGTLPLNCVEHLLDPERLPEIKRQLSLKQ